MREQKVAVAVVRDPAQRFLLVWNPRWQKFAFPTSKVDPDHEVLSRVAISALEEDLGRKFPLAQARELEYLGTFGVSGRTGEEALYEYWAFEVDPGEELNLPGGDHPPQLRPYDDLVSDPQVSWSTQEMARTFVENQEVSLAVVTRLGEAETEYLVLRNANYEGFFFPAARVKQEFKPESVARAVVRSDLGYRGETVTTLLGEVPDVHFSHRYGRQRAFRFHVCRAALPSLDLNQPENLLEKKLRAREKEWRWLTAEQMMRKDPSFSPTLPAVRATVLRLVPPARRTNRIRRSQGGVALIRREVNGQTQWLGQWNEKWQAFFFVGGHRRQGETFFNCVARETDEELGLTSTRDFTVAPHPTAELEYVAYSHRAQADTAYQMQLFEVTLTPTAQERIAANPQNRWLTTREICRQEAFDGRPVSVTMPMLLSRAGLIDCG